MKRDYPRFVTLIGGFRTLLTNEQQNAFHDHVTKTDAWCRRRCAGAEIRALVFAGLQRDVSDDIRKQDAILMAAEDELYTIGETWYAKHMEKEETEDA